MQGRQTCLAFVLGPNFTKGKEYDIIVSTKGGNLWVRLYQLINGI